MSILLTICTIIGAIWLVGIVIALVLIAASYRRSDPDAEVVEIRPGALHE